MGKLLLLLSVSGDEDRLPFDGERLMPIRSSGEGCCCLLVGGDELLGGDTGVVGRLGSVLLALDGDCPELDCSTVLRHCAITSSFIRPKASIGPAALLLGAPPGKRG